MTNKVRRDSLAPTPDGVPAGPALYFITRGTARIEHRSTSWPSRRYLATLVNDWDGWVVTPRLGHGSHGPFISAETAFMWWLQHRHALPAPRRVWRNGDPWEPEDRGEQLPGRQWHHAGEET
jgi:hypothetical protein